MATRCARSPVARTRSGQSALVVALVLLIVGGCRGTLGDAPVAPATSERAGKARVLHLVLTADEHGWLSPLRDKSSGLLRGGIGAFWDRLTRVEGYAPGPRARAAGWLLLSSGDMWTGPYESTILEGRPMVSAMNHLGYAAAAVGNHDYDFGAAVLAEHARTSTFPFLAANLVERARGGLPTWVQPFTVVEVGGVRLGLIGLTNVDSPVTTDPRNLDGLSFVPYAEALETWVPRARAAGAEEVVVLVHDRTDVALELMPVLRRLGVRAAAFGHHHRAASWIDDNATPATNDDVVVCNPGAFLRSYCRVDLTFDGPRLSARAVEILPVEQRLDEPVPRGDARLEAIVADAEANAERVGGEVLVENARALKRGADGPLGQFVVDTWLDAIPTAQVAITNAGGLRQDLAAGPVRLRDVVSVLPFNNNLLLVDITGAQLREALANPEAVVAGVRYTVRDVEGTRVVESVTDRSGRPIPDTAVVKIIVHDFIYRGGDHFRFQSYDATAEETATDWREPVVHRLRTLSASRKALDVVPDDRAQIVNSAPASQ